MAARFVHPMCTRTPPLQCPTPNPLRSPAPPTLSSDPTPTPTPPQGTRLEAAKFIHTMCTRSVLTLQMFVACYGLPALVRLLLSPAESHELVLYSIDAMKSVLDMKGHSPRNDLCRTFVEVRIAEIASIMQLFYRTAEVLCKSYTLQLYWEAL